jgi:hypothetical protein
MSSQIITQPGLNQLFVRTDVSKIFLRDNRYQTGNQVNNSSYNPMNLVAGTLMGRISATGTLAPMYAPGADGTQFPVGVLAEDVSLDSGETKQITIVDFGDVAESKIVFFYSGQTLETVVSSRRVRDYLQAQGIKLISGFEMTKYDNV